MNKITGLKITAVIFNTIFAVIILFPLVYMFSNATKDDLSVYQMPPTFLPKTSQSVQVIVDYSFLNNADILDVALGDCVVSMFGTVYNFNRAVIGEVKFYGIKNGATVFYARAHRGLINLETDYGTYASNPITLKILTNQDKSKAVMQSIGYKYALEGVDHSPKKITQSKSLAKEIENFLQAGFPVNGEIVEVTCTNNILLTFENFIYYIKAPSYVYSNYWSIKQSGFFAFFYNTLLGIVIAITSQTLLTSLTAYPLSKLFDKKTANVLMMFFLATLMIPFISVFIPILNMFKDLNITNVYLRMFLPYLLPSAFFIYLYKGFFDQLPEGLLEAARIDGASPLRIYSSICMPLSKPIISVIILNTFVNEWGNFFWYYIVANDSPANWTINLAIYQLGLNPVAKPNMIMGMAVIMTIPIIIFTIVFSNKIRDGIANTGIKG